MCGRQDHYLEGVILPYMETGLPGELNPGVFWLAAELLTPFDSGGSFSFSCSLEIRLTRLVASALERDVVLARSERGLRVTWDEAEVNRVAVCGEVPSAMACSGMFCRDCAFFMSSAGTPSRAWVGPNLILFTEDDGE